MDLIKIACNILEGQGLLYIDGIPIGIRLDQLISIISAGSLQDASIPVIRLSNF